MKKSILVVDLDGALYSINTFHYFIKFLIIQSIKRFELYFLLRVGFIVGCRLIKVVSHAKMKYGILKMISNKNVNLEAFVESISDKKNDLEVLSASFDMKILATAAPSCYADIIAKREGFDSCLGTDFPNIFNQEFENIKEVKKNNVLNYLSKEGIEEIDVFVTDHLDDFPLIQVSKRNIIVTPNKQMRDFLKAREVNYEVINI